MLNVSNHRSDRFRVNHSRTQNARRRNRQIQNRGFNSHLRLATVHNQRNFAAQLCADMLRVGRRNAAGQIRARRGKREIAFANHRLNERMTRPADADRFATGRHHVGNFLRARQNERERARPERLCQLVRQRRPAGHASFCHFIAGNVDDDGIVCRTALDLENFCDGSFIQRVCREAINRFRRQRDDFARAQKFRRAEDGLLKKLRCVRGQDFGRQSGRAWTLSTRGKIRR